MMDIDAVCEAISTAITTAALSVAGQQVTSTAFAPDAITVPHFFTAEFIGNYDKSFNRLTELTLTCRLMLARADDSSGQKGARVLASTGAGTIVSAFQGMRGAPGQSALGGACDDLHLVRVQGPRLYQIGEGQYYGLEFSVFVMG
jgi:hypothetical protein